MSANKLALPPDQHKGSGAFFIEKILDFSYNKCIMKIGLVHGRFQPFHIGHKFLVDEMLKECDLGVILIGSAIKNDEKNIFDMETRKQMIYDIYGENKKLLIGANIDLDLPYAEDAQWDVVFSSCVLSLTGYLPTHIYTGDNYSVNWERVKPKFRKFKRYDEISATDIRKLLNEKSFEAVKKIVPKQVFEIIRTRYKHYK